VATLLVLAGAGYWALGRALQPVDQITRAAERIGARSLGERLPPPAAQDELGRMVLAFNGMIDRLDRAFRREQQFTADASHELRTPLSVIRTQTELALDRPREAEYDRRVLSSIREESERLGRLVEDLLVLARADAGQTLTLAPLDLQDLVSEAGARMAPRAHAHGVQLSVTVEDVGAVSGDAAWLTQMLLNLLGNALRHTPSGGRVSLELRSAPRAAIVSVSDSGEGIAPEHLPHLFERFYRADTSRSQDAGGVGLGLAISHWIVRAHGGTISVASEPRQGATFTVTLPCADPPGDPPVSWRTAAAATQHA
jgi:heavy metal sensor kinase